MELFVAAALSIICLLSCVIVGRRIENAVNEEIPDEVIISKVQANPEFIRATARANRN